MYKSGITEPYNLRPNDPKVEYPNYLTDYFLMPLRGIIAPLYNLWRLKDNRNVSFTIPAWAVSDTPNAPIPYQVERFIDFSYSKRGRADMPISEGTVNRDATIKVQYIPERMKRTWDSNGPGKHIAASFYEGDQEMIEYYVNEPLHFVSDLPCSTVASLY